MPKESLTIKVARLEEKVGENTKSVEALTDKIETIEGKFSNFVGNHFTTLIGEVKALKATQKIIIGLIMVTLAGLIAIFLK